MDRPIVYSKSRCVQCDMTKRYLANNNIEYIEYNVEEDYEALLFVTSQGFKAAPVIFWGKESWSGFQPDKLKEIYEETKGTSQEDVCSCGLEGIRCSGCR